MGAQKFDCVIRKYRLRVLAKKLRIFRKYIFIFNFLLENSKDTAHAAHNRIKER